MGGRLSILVNSRNPVSSRQAIDKTATSIKGLLAHKLVIYLCQQLGEYRLTDIMGEFELSNVGSVSFITSQIRNQSQEDPALAKTVQQLKRYVIKYAT